MKTLCTGIKIPPGNLSERKHLSRSIFLRIHQDFYLSSSISTEMIQMKGEDLKHLHYIERHAATSHL